MGNQAADHGGISTGPAEGDVRYDSTGCLETFDGADWVPLQRVSDVEGFIFRGLQPKPPSAEEDTGNPDSPAAS